MSANATSVSQEPLPGNPQPFGLSETAETTAFESQSSPGQTPKGCHDKVRKDSSCGIVTFFRLAQKHGWRHGHVSLLLEDYRRECYQQAQQSPDENHQSRLQDAALGHAAAPAVRPSEEEIALGLGVMAITMCAFDGFLTAVLDGGNKAMGTIRTWDELAWNLLGFSGCMAAWVGVKSLVRVFEAWWTGGLEQGKGIGALKLVAFMLGIVLNGVAVVVLLFARCGTGWMVWMGIRSLILIALG